MRGPTLMIVLCLALLAACSAGESEYSLYQGSLATQDQQLRVVQRADSCRIELLPGAQTIRAEHAQCRWARPAALAHGEPYLIVGVRRDQGDTFWMVSEQQTAELLDELLGPGRFAPLESSGYAVFELGREDIESL
ncbi:MAG: hypothetical protein P9M14_02105 [Candidatus Alcyoniella australis]|nr:hypothetical protein [Candidatus Alcyoniella australis]